MRELALACNPAIGGLIITSRRTVMRHIDANFTLYASEMREQLTAARSLVHLSTDLWTSPHRHALLAVCVYWVDNFTANYTGYTAENQDLMFNGKNRILLYKMTTLILGSWDHF